MTFQAPTPPTQFDTIKDAIAWASGLQRVFWEGQNTGRRREANEVWLTVWPFSIATHGEDDRIYSDVGGDDPAQLTQIGNRLVTFQVKAHSRSAVHSNSAWLAMMKVQQRIRTPYVRNNYMRDLASKTEYLWSVAEVRPIHPIPRAWDGRHEEVAVMELVCNTVLTDIDADNATTWIESIEATSGTKDVSGTLLPADLQWDDEAIP